MKLGMQFCLRQGINDEIEKNFEKNSEIMREMMDNNDEETESDTSTEEYESDEDEFKLIENSEDTIILQMNECHATWDSWKPEETFIKNIKQAIDDKFC